MMKVIIARAPPEAKAILQPILDSLATAPGSGRYTPENFEEKVRDTGRGWTRQFGNMLEDAGFKMALSSIVQPRLGNYEAMTTEQGLMLRHGLVTGDTKMPDGTPIPANIQELTGQVRELLDGVWSHARDAGLDIGYAKNGFYPRIYDRYQAAADPAGFRKAAHELYSFMFDQELGAPGSDPQALLEKWTTMPRESRAMRTSNSLPIGHAEQERRNLRRQREIEESPAPTAAETAELDQLKIDAEQLAIDAHDSLRGHIADDQRRQLARQPDRWARCRISTPGRPAASSCRPGCCRRKPTRSWPPTCTPTRWWRSPATCTRWPGGRRTPSCSGPITSASPRRSTSSTASTA